jgi:hypothetical protein
MNIQDYLQGHFIASCKYLAQRIQSAGDLEGDVVIGWESMNEPHKAFGAKSRPAQNKVNIVWQANLV